MTVVADTTMPVPVGDDPGCGSGFPHHHQYCHPPPPPFAFSPPPSNGNLGCSHSRLPFNAHSPSPFDLVHPSPSPVDFMGSSLFGQSWPPSASFVPFRPPTLSTFSGAPNFDAFANCDQTHVHLPSRPPAPPFTHLTLNLGESEDLPPPMFPFQFHHLDNLPNLENYCGICGPPPPPPPPPFPLPLGHPHHCQILCGPLLPPPPPPPPHCCRTCGPSTPSRPPFGPPRPPHGFQHGPHQIPRTACVHSPSCSICESPIPFSHLNHHTSDDETKNCPFHAGPAPIFDSYSTPPRNDGGIKLDGVFSLHHSNHGPAAALPFGPPLSFGGFRGPQFYHCGAAINVAAIGPCHHTGDWQILCGPPPSSWPPCGIPWPVFEISHAKSEISFNPHHLGIHPPMTSCPICEPPIMFSDLHHHPSKDKSKNHPLHTSAPIFESPNCIPPRYDGGTNLGGFAGSAQFNHRGPAPATLAFGPPPPFGNFRGPSFHHPHGRAINGMGPCRHHPVDPNGSATPASSSLSNDHVVKNMTTEHPTNSQGNVSEGSGDKLGLEDELKTDKSLDPLQ